MRTRSRRRSAGPAPVRPADAGAPAAGRRPPPDGVPRPSPAASRPCPRWRPGAAGGGPSRPADVARRPGRASGLKRTTWSLVSQYAQVLDYDGARLLLASTRPAAPRSFGKGAHQEFLRQALIDIIGLDCRFEAVRATPGRRRRAPVRPLPAPPAQPAAPDGPMPQAAPPRSCREFPPPALRQRRRDGSAAGRTTTSRCLRSRLPMTSRRRSRLERGRRLAGPRPDPSGGAVPRTPPPVPTPAVVRLSDDVPSADDVDLDGSGLVGASVVEQLLGGRVIEERQD